MPTVDAPPTSGPSLRERRRTLLLALTLYVALLVWESLALGGGWSCSGRWFSEQVPGQRLSRSDVLANVVAYVPLGFMLMFLGAAALRRPRDASHSPMRWPLGRALLVSVLVAGLSAAMEVLQACLPDRTSSWIDLMTNTAGGAFGAGVAMIGERLLQGEHARRTLHAGQMRLFSGLAPMPVPLLGAAALFCWAAILTAPWVVSVDLGHIARNLRFLRAPLQALMGGTFDTAQWPDVDVWRLVRYVAAWTSVTFVARLMLRPTRSVLLPVVMMMAGALFVQALLARAVIDVERLIAMPLALGLLVALGSPRLAKLWPWVALAAAAITLVAMQLQPRAGGAQGFSWLPQTGLNELLPALMSSLWFVWVMLVCLTVAAHLRLSATAANRAARSIPILCVLGLLALEFAQAFIPGRYGDTSGPLIALLTWLAAANWGWRDQGVAPGTRST